MHIRSNIPAWGAEEVSNGLAALLRAGRGDFGSALRKELGEFADGWSPVLLSSARLGLSMAARSLGLAGKRVAVPVYVCPAVLTGLHAARVTPVPVDCAPDSVRFDLDALSRAVGGGEVEGLVSPNTYGLDQDYENLKRLGLPVMEDAAYQGGRYDAAGRACGLRADAGVWSFNFKALSGVGGGVLWTTESAATQPPRSGQVPSRIGEASRFINYALRSLGRHRIPKVFPGAGAPNGHEENPVRASLYEMSDAPMSDLQAAVALAQWRGRERIASLQRRASEYLTGVAHTCEAFSTLEGQGESDAIHLLPLTVRVKGDDDARAAVKLARSLLHAGGVQTEPPYPVTLGAEAKLPNAHRLAARLFLVPCNPSLGPMQTELIGRALKDASREVGRRFRVER
jgi:dTDP-4-amino-4,6-dideoxygalactose transaminase